MAQSEKQKEALKKVNEAKKAKKLVAQAKADAEQAEVQRQEAAAKVLAEKALQPQIGDDGYVPDADDNVSEAVDGDEGVVRQTKKKTPMNLINNPHSKMPRKDGNWKKVSFKDMVKLEEDGLLEGYDQNTGEVLIKKVVKIKEDKDEEE